MIAQCSEGALVEFAYVSQVDKSLPPAALSRLERQCWAHNVRAGITGEVRLEDGTFTQVLEGRWPEVMALASRILTDTRHTSISILAFGPIEKRRFASWSASGLSLDTAPEPMAEGPVPNVLQLHARPAALAALATPLTVQAQSHR
jgi:hypothetical protein